MVTHSMLTQIVLHISDAYSFFYARMYSTYIQQATHLTNFTAAKKNFIFSSPMNLLSSHPKDRSGIEVDSNSRERKNLSNVWEAKKNRHRMHIDEAHSGKFTNKSPCMNW